MSDINLDEPGFTAPAGSTVPLSSDSSVEHPPDGCSKCVACPKRMSVKTADRHRICVVCRGHDCNVETRCEECIEWPEEEIRLYAKMRKSLKSKVLRSTVVSLQRLLLLRLSLCPLRSPTRWRICKPR